MGRRLRPHKPIVRIKFAPYALDKQHWILPDLFKETEWRAEEIGRRAASALLICAYEDNKCEKILLEGVMLGSQFEAKLPSIPKDQEIIFYCGGGNAATSAGLADKYRSRGYANVRVLHGGIDAWKQKGYPMVRRPKKNDLSFGMQPSQRYQGGDKCESS